MDMLFWGMLLILLDVKIADLEILPDAVGYFLLILGCKDFSELKGLRFFLPVLLMLSGAGFIMALTELSVQMEFFLWCLELAGVVCGVFIARSVAWGLHRMERRKHWELGCGRLTALWGFLAAMEILNGLLSWVPVVGDVSALAAFVMCGCYLSALWDTRRRYRESLKE